MRTLFDAVEGRFRGQCSDDAEFPHPRTNVEHACQRRRGQEGGGSPRNFDRCPEVRRDPANGFRKNDIEGVLEGVGACVEIDGGTPAMVDGESWTVKKQILALRALTFLVSHDR